MTYEEKITLTQSLIGDSSASVTAHLTSAEQAILTRLFMGNTSSASVPAEYEVLQCRLAVRYYSRMGGEGEVSHSNGGVARTYSSANDEDLLSEVMPYVKLL